MDLIRCGRNEIVISLDMYSLYDFRRYSPNNIDLLKQPS